MTDQPIDEQLAQAARAFFPEATSIAPVPGHPDLVRVEAPSGEWRVRRWGADAAPERIRFGHDLLDAAADAGLGFIPRLRRAAEGSLLRLDHRLFDATSWIPGRPAARQTTRSEYAGESLHVPAALARSTHEDLSARVAELHDALQPLSTHPHAPRVTLQGIDRAVHTTWQAHRERLRPVAVRTPHVQRWLRTAERALPAARNALSAAGSPDSQRQVVGHFGLWPAHVILRPADDQDRVVGLIDVAQAAVGPPALDLAQLVTRFGGWSEETVELVTGAYGGAATLTPEDRRLLPAVSALDLTAEIGRLLAAIYAARAPDAPPAPTSFRKGADELLTSLEAVTRTLTRLEGGDRPPRRPWVPGRRRTAPAKPTGRGHRRRPER